MSASARSLTPDLGYGSLRVRLRELLEAGVEEGLTPLRLALAGQATTSLLAPLLRGFLWTHGLAARLYEAPFGTLFQEVLDPRGSLAAFGPEVLVLLPDEAAAPTGDVGTELRRWQAVWSEATGRLRTRVVQGNFVLPTESPYGNLETRRELGRRRFLQDLNAALADAAPPGVVLHDTEFLASLLGRRRWRERTWWHLARLDTAPDCLPALAHSLAALVAGAWGRSRKAVAVDLDGTLWGGVVGEVGPEGLDLGASPVGEAHLALQRYLKTLRERGILLAVVSKNDPEMARRPFRERPEMILAEDDFAGFAASWDDKPRSLEALSRELGLGLDAWVFVDDHPAEREMVRQMLPEVAVVDLPDEPADFVEALDRGRYFESLGLTEEDRRRPDLYRAEALRRQRREQASTVEEYLASLRMVLRLGSRGDADRIAQLVARTNQFNLTGRRFLERDLEEALLLAGRLRDVFGDQGLVTAVVGRVEGDTLELDNWVTSCRVLRRGVEEALFHALAGRARALGLRRIRGSYVPTPRNGLVADLLARLGFQQAGEDWEFDLDQPTQGPDWIALEEDP